MLAFGLPGPATVRIAWARQSKGSRMSLVELGRYANAMEAAMVKGVLESEGIDAVVFDQGMNIADSSGWLVPVRVMVLDDDLEVAKQLLPKI